MTRKTLSRREFVGAVLAVGTALPIERAWGHPGRSLSQVADLTELTVGEASRLIRARDLSVLDLVNAYLERIARLDSQLNAYITVTGERALARSRELEA